MKTTGIFLAALAALIMAGVGCAKPLTEADAVYRGDYGSYRKVVRQWTRRGNIYHNFETELIIDATYFSPVFRTALRKEKARAEALGEKEIARMERRDRDEATGWARFLVSAYTPRSLWNDLDARDPSFRLWLADESGRRVAPSRIKEIKFKRSADYKYYPHVNAWAKTYQVLFPLHDDDEAPALTGGKITLIVTGIQGRTRLVWDIP